MKGQKRKKIIENRRQQRRSVKRKDGSLKKLKIYKPLARLTKKKTREDLSCKNQE